MIFLADELRLLYVIALNLLVFASAYRFSRRFTPDRLHAAADAFLLYYLTQYLAVGLPGLVGLLSATTIAVVAVLCSAVLVLASRRGALAGSALIRMEDSTVVASLVFVIAYVAALIHHQRTLPVTSTDALTYHLPAAAQWLQTGRLRLHETWFFNPANTYSPLAGSTFIAWLMAPLGNDVLARFVAAPPLGFLFIAMLNLCRTLGVRTMVAALIAAAAVLARPFVSQTVLAKDDLFATAFVLALIWALSNERLRYALAPWRVGIALGLLLSTKYTAIYSLPIIVLMADAPYQSAWRWRKSLLAFAIALLIAGPWYLRNWILTGNPLYPVKFGWFSGLIQVRRSELLSSLHGVWDVFNGSYYAAPRLVNLLVIAGWVVAVILSMRRLRQPLWRAILLGPPLAIIIFALTAPYAEIRFVYPALALLFAAVALALHPLPWLARELVAFGCVIACAATAFRPEMSWLFLCIAATAGLTGALSMAVWRAVGSRLRWSLVALVALSFSLSTYVYWHAYLTSYRDSVDAWADPALYDTNTYLVYPLMGFTYDHAVCYVPTRKDVEHLTDLPLIEGRLTGDHIPQAVTRLLRENPDRQQWLQRLKRSGAQYLVVSLAKPLDDVVPPEMDFAAADPLTFERIYDEPKAGAVFRIR